MKPACLLLLLPLLASSPSWAVKRGALASGPASAAVVGIEGCSAVVIHPRALLTAAHCERHIREGRNEIHFNSRSGRGDWIRVKALHLHPGYERKERPDGKIKINDDIALVILADEITQKDVLANLPALAEESQLLPGVELTAVGMGMNREGMYSYLGDSANSDKRLAPYRLLEKRASVFFLTPGLEGVGICGGDSGGGLLRIPHEGGRAELAGILTATGGYCGERDQPGYAESVSSHLPWIRSLLEPEGIHWL